MDQIKALFLDRDGVINVNHGYVYEIDKVEFIDGIFGLITRFVDCDFVPVIVTNQSGIARSYYSEQQFFAVMGYFQTQFDQQGLPKIPAYFCPHHPDFAISNSASDCECRKPKPGMILEASSQLNIDLSQSVLIGDKLSDMLAAKRAGVSRKVLFDPKEQENLIHHQSKYGNEIDEPDFERVTALDAIEV